MESLSMNLILLALRDERVNELAGHTWFDPEIEGDTVAEGLWTRCRKHIMAKPSEPKLGTFGLGAKDVASLENETFENQIERVRSFVKRATRVELTRSLATALEESTDAFDETLDELVDRLNIIRFEDAEDIFVPLSDIDVEATKWLWRGWIPIGGLTVLAGDGGKGKSTVLMDVAAQLSRGELDCGEAGSTLIINAEDRASQVVKPRVVAAGGVESMIYTVDLERTDIEIPRSINMIEAGVKRNGVKLVIIDPVNSFLPEKFDSHKDQSIRNALAPMAQMAERCQCAVVVVLHTNKEGGIMGSKGFQNLARSVLVWGEDEQSISGQKRILAQVKSNYGKLEGSLTYNIEEIELPADSEGNIPTTTRAVADGGFTTVTAQDILSQSQQGKKMSTGDDEIGEVKLHPKTAANDRLIKHVLATQGALDQESLWVATKISKGSLSERLNFLVLSGEVLEEGRDETGRSHRRRLYKLPEEGYTGAFAKAYQSSPDE